MPHYRIHAQGRQWFCDAADPDAANRQFRVNVPGASEAELATLADLSTLMDTGTGTRTPITVHLPQPKKKRRSAR